MVSTSTLVTDSQLTVNKLSDVLSDIKNGTYKNLIKEFRVNHLASETKQKWKANNLPCFYPHAEFNKSKRLHDCLNFKSTGIITLDIDLDKSLIENIETSESIKLQLQSIPYVYAAFTSVSGGLKVLILTDFVTENSDLFGCLSKDVYLRVILEIKKCIPDLPHVDTNASGHKACFISFDENLYLNESAEILIITESVMASYRKPSVIPFFGRSDEIKRLEALSALDSIPKYLIYDERMKINFAIFDIFGYEGIGLLENHWEQSKIDNPLREQLKQQYLHHDSYHINGNYLFHIAKKQYGWSNQNVYNYPYDKSATYNDNSVSLDEAELTLDKIAHQVIDNPKDTIIKATCGLGKTSQLLKVIAKKIVSDPKFKVLIMAPTNALCNEMKGKINNFVADELNVLSPLQKLKLGKYKNKKIVSVISGKEKLCINKDDKGDIKVTCFKCQKQRNCKYRLQFNIDYQVRICPHNYLFNAPNIFEKGVKDELSKEISMDWKPDIIVVDEDPTNAAIDGQFVSVGSMSKFEYKLFESLKNDGLTTTLFKFKDSIVNAYDEEKRKVAQKASYHNGRSPNRIRALIEFLYKLTEYDLQEGEWIQSTNIILRDKENCRGIYLGRKKTVHERYENIPIIYMDATGNKEVIEKVFDRDFDEKVISVAPQPNVQVLQYNNRSFSKTSIENNSNIFQIIIDIIKANSGNTGVITYKDIQKKLIDNNIVNEDSSGYFRNIRGTNKFSDFDNLIIAGRFKLPPNTLEDLAACIFGVTEIVKSKPHSEFAIFDDEYRKKPSFIRLKNGESRLSLPLYNSDETIKLLRKHYEHSETEQALHRLRLVHGSSVKKLILLTNEVMDLPIDKVKQVNIQRNIDSRTKQKHLQAEAFLNDNKIFPFKPNQIKKILPNCGYQSIRNIKSHLNGKFKRYEVTGKNIKNRSVTQSFYFLNGMGYEEMVSAILNLDIVEICNINNLYLVE